MKIYEGTIVYACARPINGPDTQPTVFARVKYVATDDCGSYDAEKEFHFPVSPAQAVALNRHGLVGKKLSISIN